MIDRMQAPIPMQMRCARHPAVGTVIARASVTLA
jgi:hypothetical protein